MAAAWVYPTAVPFVTSPFNPLRRHPVTGVITPHTGTDFRAPTGTPLRAAAAGTVTRSTDAGGGAGRYIRIDVGGGVWIGYSHLSRRDVVVGQRVAVGQTIGLAGATGSVTAAHLHFEVSVSGTKVDPVPYLAARTGSLVNNPIGGGGGGSLPNVPDSPAIAPPKPATQETETMSVIQGYGQAAMWSTNGVTKVHLTTQGQVNDMLKVTGQASPIIVGGETINALPTYVAPPSLATLTGKVDEVKGVVDLIKTDTNILKAGVATLLERPVAEGGMVGLDQAGAELVADAVLALLANTSVTITPTPEG